MRNLHPVARSGIWSAILQWSRLGLGAAVFLILTRWLSLAEIGAAAAAQAAVVFVQQVQSAVFPDAVVQESEPSERRLSTLFWIAMAVAFLCSVGLFLVADAMAWAVGQSVVGDYLRALSVCPTLIALGVVLDGLLRKRLDTRRLAIRTTISTLLAGMLAVGLAYRGYGGWALVAFTIANCTVGTAMLFAVERWRPKRVFDRGYARALMPILLSLAGRYASSAAVWPLLQLTIAGALGTVAAGIFQIAQRVYTLVDSVTVTPVRFLALPLFARVQSNRERLQERLIQALMIGSLVGSPAYLGVLAVSPDLLPLMVGSANGKPAVAALQVLCVYGPPGLVISLTNNALTSRGLSVVVFQRAALMAALTVIPCIVAAQFSVLAVAWVYALFGGGFGMLLALLLAARHLHAQPLGMFLAVARPAAAAVLMAAALLALREQLDEFSATARLVLLIAAGAAAYPAAVVIFARPHLRTFLLQIMNRNS